MNFNRILIISFFILVLSTYQTDSGIIFSLLLKVLLLKGALFMAMPLSIGAFMMGQGMGFFAGNMMGGYMMLRAANRYHNQEKDKWSAYNSGNPYQTYSSSTSGGSGWSHSGYPHTYNFHKAYDKGKHIGGAIAALKAHKLKIVNTAHKVKGFFHHKPKPHYHTTTITYSKGPNYHHGGGWGWGKGGYSTSSSGYGGAGGGHGDDYYYAAHSKPEPVTDKYKLYPYKDWYSGATSHSHVSDKPKGYGGGVVKEHTHDFFPPAYQNYGADHGETSYSSGSVGGSVDPSSTYYTSVYEGPGHEYTGMLTHDLSEPSSYLAQSKSNEESAFLKDEDDLNISPSIQSQSSATISPNPVLEKYLEKRLEEEAANQKDVEQQDEAQQLIQMLRRAYLKQLVDSLKEEETVVSFSSTEGSRGSRSIEENSGDSLIRQILAHKLQEMDMDPSDSMIDQVMSSPRGTDYDEVTTITPGTTSSTTQPTSTTTSTEAPTTSTSTTEKATVEKKETVASTEKLIVTSTGKLLATTQIDEETPEDKLEENSMEGLLSSSTERIINALENTNLLTSTEKINLTEELLSSVITPSASNEITLRDLLDLPAMWVKADNTFSEEGHPFAIRVRRDTPGRGQQKRRRQPQRPQPVTTEQPEMEQYDEQQQQPQEEQQQQQQEKTQQGQGQEPNLAAAIPPEAQQQIQSFVEDIKKFFTLLNVLDQDQCLQKLVCDVHTNQKDPATLTPYEQNILTTFRLMKALMPPGEEDSSTKYRRAALIGETGQSLELCQQSYATCGYSSSQIITLGMQTESAPGDWTGGQQSVPASRRTDYVSLMPRVRRTLRSFYI